MLCNTLYQKCYIPHRLQYNGILSIYDQNLHIIPPSLVTGACDPSGGNKMIERWAKSFSWALGGFSGLPVPSGGVGPCGLFEGTGHVVPKVEGTVSGWFHRAALNFPLSAVEGLRACAIQAHSSWFGWPNWTIIFFLFLLLLFISSKKSTLFIQ